MPEYSGSVLVVSWVHPSGTVSLNGSYRTFTDNPDVELIEITAGADAAKTFLSGVSSGKCSISILDETGAGTLIYSALKAGTSGTLIIAPMGTVVGSPKRTIPAISLGPQRSLSYNNATEISSDFQYNGAAVDGAY